MKINLNNKEKIEAALAAVNGKADSHTFTTARQLALVVEEAEAELRKSHLPVKSLPGAVVLATSGTPVANSYKRPRKATGVRLERTSTGWFLIGLGSREIYPNEGGNVDICITSDQMQEIKDRSVLTYSVL